MQKIYKFNRVLRIDGPVKHFKTTVPSENLKLTTYKLLENEASYSAYFTLQHFQKMARSHAAMNKRVQPEKYFKAWAQSMSTLLDQSGITNEQFLNSLL